MANSCFLWNNIALFIIKQNLFIFINLVIFNQSNFPPLLLSATSLLFSDGVFTSVTAGQAVTYMRSTNGKPQPFNQFPMDKIKSRPTFFLVQEADSLRYTSQ